MHLYIKAGNALERALVSTKWENKWLGRGGGRLPLSGYRAMRDTPLPPPRGAPRDAPRATALLRRFFQKFDIKAQRLKFFDENVKGFRKTGFKEQREM